MHLPIIQTLYQGVVLLAILITIVVCVCVRRRRNAAVNAAGQADVPLRPLAAAAAADTRIPVAIGCVVVGGGLLLIWLRVLLFC